MIDPEHGNLKKKKISFFHQLQFIFKSKKEACVSHPQHLLFLVCQKAVIESH